MRNVYASLRIVVWLASFTTGLAPLHAQDTASGQDAPAYRAAVERAVAAYGAGSYVEARLQFERAHAVYPNARTLRGLGLSALALHDYAAAVRHFEQALTIDVLPLEGDLRAGTEQSLREARAALDAQAAPPPAPPQTSPQTSPQTPTEAPTLVRESTSLQAPTSAQAADARPGHDDAWRAKLGPWLATGAGAVGLVTGSVLLGLALRDRHDLEGAERGTVWTDARQDTNDRVPRQVAVGSALLGLGAVAIAGGLTWRWWPRERPLAVGLAGRSLVLTSRW